MAKLPKLQTYENKEVSGSNPTMRVTYKTTEGGSIVDIAKLELKKKPLGVVTIVGDEKVTNPSAGSFKGEVKAYVTPSTIEDKDSNRGYNPVLRKFEEGIDYNEIYLEGVWTEDPSRRRGKEGVLYLADIK